MSHMCKNMDSLLHDCLSLETVALSNSHFYSSLEPWPFLREHLDTFKSKVFIMSSAAKSEPLFAKLNQQELQDLCEQCRETSALLHFLSLEQEHCQTQQALEKRNIDFGNHYFSSLNAKHIPYIFGLAHRLPLFHAYGLGLEKQSFFSSFINPFLLFAVRDLRIACLDYVLSVCVRQASFSCELVHSFLAPRNCIVEACEQQSEEASAECLDILLRRCKLILNPNIPFVFSHTLTTPLHVAVKEHNVFCVRKLLDLSDVDINAPDSSGQTALELAFHLAPFVKSSHLAETRLLRCVYELLDFSVIHNDARKKAAILLDVNTASGIKRPLLLELLERLLLKRSVFDKELASRLLQDERVDASPPCVLFSVIKLVALDKTCLLLLKLLLTRSDVNVNARDNSGINAGQRNTALQFAIESKSLDAANALLKHPRVDMHVQNADGLRAFDTARAVGWKLKSKTRRVYKK